MFILRDTLLVCCMLQEQGFNGKCNTESGKIQVGDGWTRVNNICGAFGKSSDLLGRVQTCLGRVQTCLVIASWWLALYHAQQQWTVLKVFLTWRDLSWSAHVAFVMCRTSHWTLLLLLFPILSLSLFLCLSVCVSVSLPPRCNAASLWLQAETATWSCGVRTCGSTAGGAWAAPWAPSTNSELRVLSPPLADFGWCLSFVSLSYSAFVFFVLLCSSQELHRQAQRQRLS